MNTIMKTALGAVMLGGAALAGTAPASAAVFGVTVGVPGVAVGYYAPNACYRPLAWRPAYCFNTVYGAPAYYGAEWYAPYRVYGGREVVVRDRFDRDRIGFRDNDARIAVAHRDVR
ncbi:MAG TPA: hypothetical protein VKR31_09645 [Rhizomicrobium sp.]|nr:hypothetical protein [Rhizomicrobium sp.]